MRLIRNGRIINALKQRLLPGVMAVILFMAMPGIGLTDAWAMEEGTYLVTIVPSYKDPETGKIDDPGNNEAIGQGMTERMCGSTALLEVDSSGTMYLTVRYYLSQFINNVTFEERSGGSFQDMSFQEMQSKEAVEGASDIADKYGYTDYRMKIASLESVYRGKAFIVPAGRNVVFFFTAKNPVAGSGDFITSMTSKSKEEKKAPLTVLEAEESDDQVTEESPRTKEAAWKENKEMEEDFQIGGGEVNDPVTGIPQKSILSETAKIDSENKEEEENSYHLKTSYDLSKVSIKEARGQTKEMIDGAVGVVKVTNGNGSEAQDTLKGEKNLGSSQKVMMGLFGASAVLLVYIGIGTLKKPQGDKA
jgi:hypothetical protein